MKPRADLGVRIADCQDAQSGDAHSSDHVGHPVKGEKDSDVAPSGRPERRVLNDQFAIEYIDGEWVSILGPGPEER